MTRLYEVVCMKVCVPAFIMCFVHKKHLWKKKLLVIPSLGVRFGDQEKKK
jgi:hypothetical protein